MFRITPREVTQQFWKQTKWVKIAEKVGKKRSDTDVDQLPKQNVDKGKRKTRATSRSEDVTGDSFPESKKRKKLSKRKQVVDDVDDGINIKSIVSLVESAKAKRSKESETNQNIETELTTYEPRQYKFTGLPRPLSNPDKPADDVTDRASVSSEQGSESSSMKTHDAENSNSESWTPRTTPKRQVKAYGMPQVIQGKIIGETGTSIYLKVSKSITICGKAYVRSVKGTVKVAGFEIRPSARNTLSIRRTVTHYWQYRLWIQTT